MVNSALDSDTAAKMAGRGSSIKRARSTDSDRLHAVSSARQELGDLDPPVSKPPVRVN
jgi:hypothetical protein